MTLQFAICARVVAHCGMGCEREPARIGHALPSDRCWYLRTHLPSLAFIFPTSPSHEDKLVETFTSVATRLHGHLVTRIVRIDRTLTAKDMGGSGTAAVIEDFESENPAVVHQL